MRSIHTEIEVEASEDRVWDVLTDLTRFPEWNPLLPEARGEVREGESLDVCIAPPGMGRSRYRLKVLTVVPKREFRWLGHFLVKGLIDGDHRFLIEPLGNRRVRLVQSENFSGALVPIVGARLLKNMRRGFEMMNEALKGRAEGRAAAPERTRLNPAPAPGACGEAVRGHAADKSDDRRSPLQGIHNLAGLWRD
jgi:hypothetical protein